MFWLLGGDVRNYWVAQTLREHGYTLQTYQVPQLPSSPLPKVISRLILPFPSVRDDRIVGTEMDLHTLLEHLDASSKIYGAQFGAWRESLESCGAEIRDLYNTEPLTTANAVPTAEAAIALAIQHTAITIQGAHCLVIGAGRIGKILAQKLHLLGANVTLTARKAADRALAEANGLRSDITGQYLHGLSQYDMVYNTVPHPCLSEDQLRSLPPDCLLIELASSPGFAQESCKKLGLHSILALGLPGRFSPKTAGILYAKSIMERESSA